MNAKTTGKIINAKRKEKGLTQIQLARILNVSNRAVSKWENGDGFPDISLLPDIAAALDITIDELLTGSKPEPIVQIIEVENEESKTDKLINEFKISFIISLFFSVCAALLGGITEIYCIWAFPILFYTHWEIMFACASLFLLIAGCLIFVVGVTRLHLKYSKEKIINLAAKKGLVLTAVSFVFPLTFLARIIDFSRWGYFTPYIMLFIIAVTLFTVIKCYRKIIGTKNEKNKNDY